MLIASECAKFMVYYARVPTAVMLGVMVRLVKLAGDVMVRVMP